MSYKKHNYEYFVKIQEPFFLQGLHAVFFSTASNNNPPVKRGGISVSGIAPIKPAAHKCAFYWSDLRAIVTCYPLNKRV